MDLALEGRVAIVTGAGRGLGRAAVLALVAEGAKVLGVARSTDELQRLREEGPDAIAVAECDMRDLDAVAALPDQALAAHGHLDVIVNNAGIAPAGRYLDHDDALWQEVFEINVFAPVALARAAHPHLVSRGGGKVINIASLSGFLGKAGLVAYSSSKGALLQMTKALAAEWARDGIQVNAIAPGAYDTSAQAAVLEDPEILRRRLRKIPAARMGRGEEIGPLVCLLASSASDFITGAVMVTDGGESAKL
jgi:2-dehydro-3-deoxy-D-gluconate 5-dehydrogenase